MPDPRLRPEGATLVQPRAAPWDPVSLKAPALKGRSTEDGHARVGRPFRAPHRISDGIPRALPWAVLALPLRGEDGDERNLPAIATEKYITKYAESG